MPPELEGEENLDKGVQMRESVLVETKEEEHQDNKDEAEGASDADDKDEPIELVCIWHVC